MQTNGVADSKAELAKDGRPFAQKCVYALLLALILHVVYDLSQQDYASRYAFGFTAVGIWAFGIAGMLIGHLCLPSTRHRFKKTSLMLLAYVGSYTYMSAGGAYCFSQSGQIRYTSGLSVSDVSIWHPRFMYWEPFQDIDGNSTSRGSAFGYYYSPLITVDRYWLHPTQQLIAGDGVAATGAKCQNHAAELWSARNHMDRQPPQPANGRRYVPTFMIQQRRLLVGITHDM